jgi:hypothetical protein
MTVAQRTGRLPRALRSIALALFVAAVSGLAAWPKLHPEPTAHQYRELLWAEIQPVVLENCTMRRFGSANDGGYLMCENLLGRVESAYSYGIGPADDWGCDVSRRYGVTVHQYDCFSPPEAACPNGRSVFHDECIGPQAATMNSHVFDTLTHQLVKNGDAGKTLVVKMDIEGAEQASLMATSDQVLNRIDQFAMELHGTNRDFLELVRKLKRTFYLVHLHFNNQACARLKYSPLPAGAYQVLFVNKRIGILDRTKPRATLPNPLDAPDYARGHDCQAPILP